MVQDFVQSMYVFEFIVSRLGAQHPNCSDI